MVRTLGVNLKTLLVASGLGICTAACATIGTRFSFPGPKSITVGKTDKSELLAEFGRPTRVGYDNGQQKWAYAYYHYAVFGASDVRNLDVVFNSAGLVSSYTYESSDPGEIQNQLPAGASKGRSATGTPQW